MLKFSGTIIYFDGRQVAFEGGQREFAAWERYATRNGLPLGMDGTNRAVPITMGRYVAYACQMRGTDNAESFEVWDESVAEVEAGAEQLETADPTQPAASADWSQPSQ
jgi:hypothetical protein